MFWTLLRAHFNPGLAVQTKMSLNRARHIFMPANINPILLVKAKSENLILNNQKKKNKPDSIANVVPANKTGKGTKSQNPKKNNSKNTEIYNQRKIIDEIG